MDFINKAFAQISELFRPMTIGARITAGLLLSVVVVSLVWLFRYQASSPDLYLMNGVDLSPNDLTAMRAAFGAAGLNSYEAEGDRIRVPRGQQHLYMAALADNKALPNQFFRYMEEAINGGSSYDGRHVFDARYKLGIQKELSLIIGKMKGIERATVMFDVETKPGLVRETTKTALASVKPLGSGPLDESQVSAIRQAVAAAIADMKPNAVKVVDENSGRTFHSDAESGSSAMDERYYDTKRRAEKQWTTTILSAISYVPGVTVAVNVELEKELQRRETEHKPDQKAVPLRTKENTRSRTREGSVPGGRPGFQTNQPQTLAQPAGKGSHEEEEETTSTAENYLGTTSVEKELPGLTPTRVTASIGIPVSYFASLWREENPTRPGEEPKTPSPGDLDPIRTQAIAKIKSHVAPLLPQPEKTTDKTNDLTELVTVTAFPDIAPEPTPVPGLPVQTLDWLVQNWSMLGLIFLGGFSLVVLRSIARSAPASSPRPLSLSLPADLGSPAERSPEPQETLVAAERRLRRVGAGGPSLRDELSELVAEDPDAAAGILRTWIGNVR